METEFKCEFKSEVFFATEVNALDFYHQVRAASASFNLIRFNYFNGRRKLYYYLVTTSTLMTVVCEACTYLGMVAKYSCRRFGYEPVDNDYFLTGIELMDV